MKVLGIDPGSERLGWGIVDGRANKYSLIAHGVVRSNPRHAFSKRLMNIFTEMDKVVGEHGPEVIAIEEAFYSINVNVAMKLGQVRGIMLLLAELRGLSIAEYAPRLIKKTVVGYGNAEKHQVGEMIRILLGLKSAPEPHDVSDALAAAICHFHHNVINEKLKNAVSNST
ncbi:MAG: crossover junction endodeoxyribonuclease RuvC [Chloracidobacterium sp.]|nr:crossover junction endodeoxyribonuclease RuvC [Chloracidobacterium sp.]